MRIRIIADRARIPAALDFFLLGMDVDFEVFEVERAWAEATLTAAEGAEAAVALVRDVTALPEALARTIAGCAQLSIIPLADERRKLDFIRLGFRKVLEFPREAPELRAELRALAAPVSATSNGVFAGAEARFDPVRRTLSGSGCTLELTRGEARVLETLLRSPNVIVPRAAHEMASGRSRLNANSRALDVMVSAVRKKLRLVDQTTEIACVQSIGYRLEGHWRWIGETEEPLALVG